MIKPTNVISIAIDLQIQLRFTSFSYSANYVLSNFNINSLFDFKVNRKTRCISVKWEASGAVCLFLLSVYIHLFCCIVCNDIEYK